MAIGHRASDRLPTLRPGGRASPRAFALFMKAARVRETDEAVVARARRAVAGKSRLRWGMLLNAILFLGLSVYATVAATRNIGDLDGEQLSMGFIAGLALAAVWTSFGILGALCLGKVLVGFSDVSRIQDLVARYHDQLRNLAQLPEAGNGEPVSRANGPPPTS
jgi:hypothetical protein